METGHEVMSASRTSGSACSLNGIDCFHLRRIISMIQLGQPQVESRVVYLGTNLGSTLGFAKRSIRSGLVLTALVLAFSLPGFPGAVREKVLDDAVRIGQSHPAPALVTNQILLALSTDPRFYAELHWENLDAIDISDDARNELRDGIVRKYRNLNWDLIVLVGPDPLRLFAMSRLGRVPHWCPGCVLLQFPRPG